MNERNLAKIAFVMGGIYALIASVPLLQALVTMPFFPEETAGNNAVIVLAWLLPFLLLLLSGTFLITARDRLARWILPDVAEQTPTVVRPDDFQDLAFAVLGIYLVLSTLPNLGRLASALINLRGSETFHEYLGVFRENVVFYLGTVTKLIGGAYLFMYAHSVGVWWRKRRTAPVHQESHNLESRSSRCPSCGEPFSASDYRQDTDIRLCSRCQRPLPKDLFETSA